MSYLVPELNLIVERIMVLAPRRQDLVELFERFCFELTTDLVKPNQRLDMINYAPIDPSVNSFVAWTTVTLGQRSGADVRLTLTGFALENGLPSENAFEMADGYVFFEAEDTVVTEHFLKMSLSTETKKKAAVLIQRLPNGDDIGLRRKALATWFQRHFKNPLTLRDGPKLLDTCLDWVLVQ